MGPSTAAGGVDDVGTRVVDDKCSRVEPRHLNESRVWQMRDSSVSVSMCCTAGTLYTVVVMHLGGRIAVLVSIASSERWNELGGRRIRGKKRGTALDDHSSILAQRIEHEVA